MIRIGRTHVLGDIRWVTTADPPEWSEEHSEKHEERNRDVQPVGVAEVVQQLLPTGQPEEHGTDRQDYEPPSYPPDGDRCEEDESPQQVPGLDHRREEDDRQKSQTYRPQ